MLHHDGQLRALITLAIGSYRLPGIFETVAVKTVMHGNPVEGFEPGKFGELVNEPGRKKDLRSRAVRPVRTYEIKRLAGRNDVGYPRPADLDGFIAGEFLQRFAKEIRRGPPLSSEQAMDGVGAQIALAALIAEQRPPVAPSQDERGAEASRPAADNENIELHQKPFRCQGIWIARLCLEPLTAVRTLAVGKRIMPRAKTAAQWTELTLEERRERRRLRREKQREDNVKRAAKMHAARLKSETSIAKPVAEHKQAVFVGCSGWRYWKWRDSFYEGVPQNDWFGHYLKRFDTVEINASFYSWPTVAGVQSWRRQPGRKKFVYTVKVCELITHIKKFKGTKTLVKDFGMIADILGDRMGCFLFQLPPSYRYTKTRLNDIVSQLDPARRNVVEFRHVSWWNEEVYSAFRKAGIIFCSCSGPRLPDELVRTADEVYVRLHGPKRWYRHDYSKEELAIWADRIKASGATRAWVYFNNDNDAHAPKNATTLRRMLGRSLPGVKPAVGTLPISQTFSEV